MRAAARNRTHRFAQLGEALQAVSVRTKILGMVLALTTVLGLAVAFQVRMTTTGVLERELDLRGEAVANHLAAHVVDPLLLGDAFRLHELVRATTANEEDLAYAFVLDADGTVVAHSFEGEGFPTRLLEVPNGPGPHVFNTQLGRVHDFRVLVLDGRAGEVRIGLTEARLRSLLTGVTLQMLLTTVAVALAGIIAAFLLTRIIVHPIKDLVATTRRVGAGDLSARAPEAASDEIGVLAGAFNQMVEDLEESQALVEEKEHARARLLDQLISAQEEERKRIARELHDGVGQSLNSLVLGLSSLASSNGDSPEQVARLRGATLETLESVRQLSRQLRPSVLDDLGLGDALELYASEVAARHPQLRVDTHIDLDRRLPASVETAVYRMIQEGMTNAARHSGARTLSVVVTWRDNRLQAIIEDDGSGFDVESSLRTGQSVGIHAIHERAELVGGRAHFESGQTGTTVFIEVPL